MKITSYYNFWLCALIIFFASHVNTTATTSSLSTQMRAIKDYIFANYSKDLLPATEEHEPVTLELDMAINQILDLESISQTLKMNIWQRWKWRDLNLAWDPSEFENVSSIVVPPGELWLPDIVLYNDVRDQERDMSIYACNISSDGTINWRAPVLFMSSCKLNMRYFPFDKQSCELKFGSWVYNGYILDVVTNSSEADATSYIENGIWHLESSPVVRNVRYYSCCPEPYPDVTYTINIRRRPLFYIFNLVIPCIMILSVTCVSFLLPVDSGEKVSLGVSLMLALTVFLLITADNTPAQSEVIPMLGLYFALTIGLLTVSSAMSVVVTNIHFAGNFGTRPPRWVRTVFLDCLGYVVCKKEIIKQALGDNILESHQYRVSTLNIPQTARMRKDTTETSTPKSTLAFENKGFESTETLNGVASNGHAGKSGFGHGLPETSTTNEILLAMLSVMKANSWKEQEKDKAESAATEWKLVAMVIDRFVLWAFIIVTIFMFLFCLLYDPDTNSLRDYA